MTRPDTTAAEPREDDAAKLARLISIVGVHPSSDQDSVQELMALVGKVARRTPARGDADETAGQEPVAWQSMENAPKDGTMLLLLVPGEDGPLEDEVGPTRTIGRFNVFDDDRWLYACWSWEQDCYYGDVDSDMPAPIGWLPLPNIYPPAPPTRSSDGGVDAAWEEYEASTSGYTYDDLTLVEHAFRAGHAANTPSAFEAVAAVERLRDEWRQNKDNASYETTRSFWDNHVRGANDILMVLRALPAAPAEQPRAGTGQADREAVIEAWKKFGVLILDVLEGYERQLQAALAQRQPGAE